MSRTTFRLSNKFLLSNLSLQLTLIFEEMRGDGD